MDWWAVSVQKVVRSRIRFGIPQKLAGKVADDPQVFVAVHHSREKDCRPRSSDGLSPIFARVSGAVLGRSPVASPHRSKPRHGLRMQDATVPQPIPGSLEEFDGTANSCVKSVGWILFYRCLTLLLWINLFPLRRFVPWLRFDSPRGCP